eukprot:scaffold65981_cov54-Phaeocystis_antarctica.AAC.2
MYPGCSHCCFDASPQQGACCSPRAIYKQQLLCRLDRFSALCVRHISRVRCVHSSISMSLDVFLSISHLFFKPSSGGFT